MRLGMINGWDDASIREVREKGLSHVEFCMNTKWEGIDLLKEAPEIAARLKRHGVACGAVGRWGEGRIDDDGKIIQKGLTHDKHIIDVAATIGAPVFNVGSNVAKNLSFDENLEATAAYLREIIDYATAKGIKVALYNCSWGNFAYDSRTWVPLLKEFPALGLKYDPSHSIRRGGDYLAEMRDFSKYFYHFHIKGTMDIGGVPYDDPPAGMDDIKWGPVFNLLYTNGYKGMVSLEPHSGRWSDAMDQWGVDFSIRYISQFIMPEDYVAKKQLYRP